MGPTLAVCQPTLTAVLAVMHDTRNPTDTDWNERGNEKESIFIELTSSLILKE
jgi:hypothetical protein